MRWAVAAALLALVGCSDDGETVGGNVCEDATTPYETYSVGIVKEGESGEAKIKLVDANPAPPARGNNSWTVQVLDLADAPLPDASITTVKPFMPDHGHGTNVTPEIGDVGADGMAQVDSIDFMMPGVWTVTVEVETPAATDRAVFAFCIDG